MRNFKIHVTPEQSEVVQKLLFLLDFQWGYKRSVMYLEKKYLFVDCDYKKIRMSNNDDMDFFNTHDNREVTFDHIINEIELELNEKFQNKSYTISI